MRASRLEQDGQDKEILTTHSGALLLSVLNLQTAYNMPLSDMYFIYRTWKHGTESTMLIQNEAFSLFSQNF